MRFFGWLGRMVNGVPTEVSKVEVAHRALDSFENKHGVTEQERKFDEWQGKKSSNRRVCFTCLEPIKRGERYKEKRHLFQPPLYALVHDKCDGGSVPAKEPDGRPE